MRFATIALIFVIAVFAQTRPNITETFRGVGNQKVFFFEKMFFVILFLDLKWALHL